MYVNWNDLPHRHKAQCMFNVVPTLWTLGQHYTSIVLMIVFAGNYEVNYEITLEAVFIICYVIIFEIL